MLLIESDDYVDYVDYPDRINMLLTKDAGIVLTFGIDNKESFEKIKEIRENIMANNKEIISPMILVGNKKDLENERKISYDEAKNLANSWGIEYIETSAKNNYNCKEVFEKISKLVLGVKMNKKQQNKNRHCLVY